MYGPLAAALWLARLESGSLLGCVVCRESSIWRLPGLAVGSVAALGIHPACVPTAMERGVLDESGSRVAVGSEKKRVEPIRKGAYARRKTA